jgi:hypothetical protein
VAEFLDILDNNTSGPRSCVEILLPTAAIGFFCSVLDSSRFVGVKNVLPALLAEHPRGFLVIAIAL